MGLSVVWGVVTEIHARSTWPSALGRIISAGQKSSKGMSASSRYSFYWVEYEVEFAVSEDRCKTGLVSTVPDQPSQVLCGGTTRTRSTRSPSTVFGWLNGAHQVNSPVRILYDPEGPTVKIAGESPWLVYRWPDIFLACGWLAVFFTLESFVTRRLRDLELLPSGYDANPPAPPAEPRPWDLIDLNPPRP